MKTLVSWSTGKDSAWALQRLMAAGEHDIAGLFCTINKKFARTAMHAVRIDLLQAQAERLGLPLDIIEIPYPCTNQDYECLMGDYVMQARQQDIEGFAFGDLFLQDIRDYRVTQLDDTGVVPLFPLWQEDTAALAREMIVGGLEAVITCIDPRQLDPKLAGRRFDLSLLADLPANADPCGEHGEFHTFVYNAPLFTRPIQIIVGDIVTRDGFVFADVTSPVSQA